MEKEHVSEETTEIVAENENSGSFKKVMSTSYSNKEQFENDKAVIEKISKAEGITKTETLSRSLAHYERSLELEETLIDMPANFQDTLRAAMHVTEEAHKIAQNQLIAIGTVIGSELETIKTKTETSFKKQLETATTKIDRLLDSEHELKATIKTLKQDKAELSGEAAHLSTELSLNKKATKALEATIEEKNERIKNIETTRDMLREDVADQEKQLKTKGDKIVALTEENTILQNKKAELEDEIRELESDKTQINTTLSLRNQEIENANRIIEDLKQQLEAQRLKVDAENAKAIENATLVGTLSGENSILKATKDELVATHKKELTLLTETKDAEIARLVEEVATLKAELKSGAETE